MTYFHLIIIVGNQNFGRDTKIVSYVARSKTIGHIIYSQSCSFMVIWPVMENAQVL